MINMDNIECAQKLVKAAKKLVGFEFPSKNALDGYLQRHPKADPKKHWVKGEKDKQQKQDDDSGKSKPAVSDESKSNPKIDTHSSWQGKAKHIIAVITKEPKSIKRLGGGVNGTYKEKHEGDIQSVWKPEAESGRIRGLRLCLSPRASQSKREALAYQVDQLFGFNVVPPTIYTKKKYKNAADEEVESEGSSQFMVDGTTGFGLSSSTYSTYKDGSKNFQLAAQKVALFDRITGNTDRHGGNWMQSKDKDNCYAIDNGLTFAPEDDKGEFRSELWGAVMDVARDKNDEDHPFDPELIKHVSKVKEEDFMKLMEDTDLKPEGKACWKRWTVIRDSYGPTIANPPPEEKTDPHQMKLELKTPSKKPEPQAIEPVKKLEQLDAKFQHALQKALGDKAKNLPPAKLLKLFNALAKKGYFDKGNTDKTLQVMQEIAEKMTI